MEYILLNLKTTRNGCSLRIPESCPENLRAALSQVFCCAISVTWCGALELYSREQFEALKDRIRALPSPAVREQMEVLLLTSCLMEMTAHTICVPMMLAAAVGLEGRAALVLDDGRLCLMRPERAQSGRRDETD